jgi:hypothetical protein
MNFESVRNFQETLVFARVMEVAPQYPRLEHSQDLLVDAACIALNALKPRYIRYNVDLSFHLLDRDRAEAEADVNAAVDAAFKLLSAGRRKEDR